MWDEITEFSILYDFYGELLPEKMREIFRLYHEENLSLAEIAESFGMSRQGVHESVRRAEEKLRGYEATLGLAERFTEQETVLNELRESIRALEAGDRSPETREIIRTVSRSIARLEG